MNLFIELLTAAISLLMAGLQPTPDSVSTLTPTTVAPAAPATPTYRNRVIGPGVNVAVTGTYRDCTFQAPVGWAGAYIDACHPQLWVMAHPPFFGAMNSWGVGTEVTYWDGNGVAHVYHIIRTDTYPPQLQGDQYHPIGSAHFQVCTTNTDYSPISVLDAS